jgi:putative autotransporter adhesin-like protein
MTRIGKIQLLATLMLAAAVVVCAGGARQTDGDGFQQIPGIREFDGIVNTTRADVIIRVEQGFSVRARGDSRVLEQYRFDVQGGRLRIRNPWRPWYILSAGRDHAVLVEVTMPRLSSLRLTGSGDARVEGTIHADTLTFRTTGSGGISANGHADVLEITITGSGDTEFAGSCDEADIDLAGSGELRLALEARAVEARISGSGDVGVRGSAGDIRLQLVSSGEFRGENFTATTANVTITGSGDASLAVQRELSARLSGGGDLLLTDGSPEIDLRTTGSGRVVEMAGE